MANSTDGSTFGGLIVPDNNFGLTGNTTGFGYLNPVGGGIPEYGLTAIGDAVRAGGNAASPGTATFEGISSTNASGHNNGVIGYYDNNAVGNTPFYSNWRGVDLTASGPAQGTPVTMISPTYIGDATLRGLVALDDYQIWQTGYLAGDSTWQSGDFLDDGKVNLDSYQAWQTVYLAAPGQYPNFIPPVQAGPVQINASPVQLSGAANAVPEPTTCSLLLVAALAAIAFRFRRGRAAL